jgi:hypothetical protein
VRGAIELLTCLKGLEFEAFLLRMSASDATLTGGRWAGSMIPSINTVQCKASSAKRGKPFVVKNSQIDDIGLDTMKRAMIT